MLKVLEVWKSKQVLQAELVDALAVEAKRAADLIGQVRSKKKRKFVCSLPEKVCSGHTGTDGSARSKATDRGGGAPGERRPAERVLFLLIGCVSAKEAEGGQAGDAVAARRQRGRGWRGKNTSLFLVLLLTHLRCVQFDELWEQDEVPVAGGLAVSSVSPPPSQTPAVNSAPTSAVNSAPPARDERRAGRPEHDRKRERAASPAKQPQPQHHADREESKKAKKDR